MPKSCHKVIPNLDGWPPFAAHDYWINPLSKNNNNNNNNKQTDKQKTHKVRFGYPGARCTF